MSVLVLGHKDVLTALPPAECVEVMARALTEHARGQAFMPLRSVIRPPSAAGLMGLMPAWRGDGDGGAAVFSLKAICLIPSNPARGLDAHQGVVALFDGETGVATALLDASAVTEVRTAAVTAVATRLLAREDAGVLAILGAGVQARAHLDALKLVRMLRAARVYAPTREHAEAVAEYGASLGLEVTASESAEEALAGADLVVVATSSREPVLRREWLAPGAHVNAVGASAPSAREIDTATVAASALFVDSRESLRNEAGEYLLAVREGVIAGEDHVRGELGEVLAGLAEGRRDNHELTLFRSLGLGIEDLAAAEHAVSAARRLGLGTEVQM